MSVLNENQLLGASGASGDYEIDQSLRFDDGRGSSLTRTPASASNRKTFTISFWMKRGVGGFENVIRAYSAGNDYDAIQFTSGNQIRYFGHEDGTNVTCTTNALYRDSSSWYHFLISVDTTQSTSSNRIKIYANGVLQTLSTATYPSQNEDLRFNSAVEHEFSEGSLDAYLAEFNFIDGQALTPDSFGETGTYGEWKPTKYAGTYGTNGFYLPFEQDYTVEGFSTVLWEGSGTDGSAQYVGGVGFSPDMTWMKTRIGGYNPVIFDQVRGHDAGYLQTDGTQTETAVHGYITPKTDGFEGVRGTDAGALFVNKDDTAYVAWNWDMGGTTASNTSGSITSSVRANTTYGQSIVSYTGTGSAATVGHGLASAPDMVICRPRNLATHWRVWHEGLTNGTYTLFLNSTGAQQVQSDAFGSLPTSSVFSVATDLNTNTQPYIAYCFHSVTNYSSFGSYSGSGSSGKVVTTGFAPAFVLIKRTDAANIWSIYDNTRNPNNPVDKFITNSSVAENNTGGQNLNFTSTGFTVESNGNSVNASGGTYIYMAFADTREYAYWYDQSGNNNDWTSEGGLTESDVMVDSPTNNFCVLNPLDEGGSNTVSEGNLQYIKSGSNFGPMRGTLGVTTGKWYFEAMRSSNSNICQVGVSNNYNISQSGGDNTMGNAGGIGAAWDSRGYYYRTGGNDSGKNTFATNEIVSVAFDADTGKIWWRKSGGSWQDSGNPETGANPSFTASGYSELMPFVNGEGGGGLVANFGSDSSFAGNKTPQGNQDANGIGDFYYAPPTGFLALCTKSLPSVDVIPSEHFNTVTWTGNGSARSITTGVDADLVWTKARNQTYDHNIFDSVRGTLKKLSSNSTGAESSMTNSLTAFNTDGFTLGDTAQVNLNGGTFVAWNWKAGGSASSNTNGSITSSVSANVDAGFSVVSYTGNGSAGATIGHGLSKKVELVINKRRTSATEWWIVYHSSVCTGDDNWLALNTTGALRSGGESMYDVSGFTSTTFGVNAGSGVNVSGATQIAYCFHSVESYSKVGSYTGNTSSTDGTFVHCGFAVSFLLIKDTGAGNTWVLLDSKRDSINPNDTLLQPQSSAAETTGWAGQVDFLSNGFKIRSNDNGLNAARTYIFYAIAENPFKHTNAR